jgi:hypothetical protein
MKPIELLRGADKRPKNSKVDDDKEGYSIDVYIFDYVRLWENNAADQKMTCDIYMNFSN